MNNSTKLLLFLTGVGATYFGIQKIRNLSTTIEGLKIVPDQLHSFNYSGGKINFNVDLLIQNPNSESIDFELKQLVLKSQSGTEILRRTPDSKLFNIPASGFARVKNIQFQIFPTDLASNIIEILKQGITALRNLTLELTASANGIDIPKQTIQIN